MGQTDKLRALLAEEGALVLPGCFDALTARLIERAGYSGAFMGGFAVSASRLGAPARNCMRSRCSNSTPNS